MRIEGCTALVTGANRGLGRAFAAALVARGAARVYAAARDPGAIDLAGVDPVALDVTRDADIARVVAQCGDVTLLINNAGIFEPGSLMADDATASLRRQIAVNAVAPLALSHAFAPVIAANGGGAIANMLSVTSWFATPMAPAYAASKHAALALTDGLRMALRERRIQVTAIYAGFIDTDMAAGVDQPKVSPAAVADAALAGIAAGDDHVFADDRAHQVWHATRTDPYGFLQRLDDAHRAAAGRG